MGLCLMVEIPRGGEVFSRYSLSGKAIASFLVFEDMLIRET